MTRGITKIEKKGLGAKIGEVDIFRGIGFRVGGTYHRYAALIKEDQTGKYNILILDDPRSKNMNGFPYIEEGTYIFPKMVGERTARKRYKELK